MRWPAQWPGACTLVPCLPIVKMSKILKRVEQLQECAAAFPQDAERCRQLEWELWRDYLFAEAVGKGSPAKAAAVADTTKIKFDRWGGSF